MVFAQPDPTSFSLSSEYKIVRIRGIRFKTIISLLICMSDRDNCLPDFAASIRTCRITNCLISPASVFVRDGDPVPVRERCPTAAYPDKRGDGWRVSAPAQTSGFLFYFHIVTQKPRDRERSGKIR